MTTTLYPLTVKEVRKETEDCVSIAVNVPNELKSTFDFVQGQYLTFETEIYGEAVRRAYSLCSSPLDNEWRVAIKKVPGGKFSTFANEALVIGDELKVMPPQGKFFTKLDTANEKHYLAFAAGSGITPVLSILKTVLMAEPKSKFTLVYGNKGFSDIIFFETLEALKNKFIGRLVIHHVFSREALDAPVNNGRIDGEKLEQLGEGLIDFSKIDEVFICGPLGMTEALRDGLPGKGVPKEKIHFELFNTEVEGKQRTYEPKLTEKEAKQMAQVQVTLDGKTIQFPLGFAGSNILDAALKKGADLPFACKGGVCCTCRAKLVEGAVDMEVNYGLEQEEIDAGFILTCQAHPRSESIIVDFDQT